MLRRLSAVALHSAAMVKRSPRPETYWSHFLTFDLPRVSKEYFFLTILSCGLSVRFGLPPILSWVDGNLPRRTDVGVDELVGDNEAIEVDNDDLAGDNEAIEVDNFEVVDAGLSSFLLLSFCDFLIGTMKSPRFAPTCRVWPLSSSKNASKRLLVATGGLAATVTDARRR